MTVPKNRDGTRGAVRPKKIHNNKKGRFNENLKNLSQFLFKKHALF